MELMGEECLGCQRCLSVKGGRQKGYPCQPEEKFPIFQGLLGLLKRLFSKKRWRELRGRIKPGTHRREKSGYKAERKKRQMGSSGWQIAKRETEGSGREIDSESPRIVTLAVYGPNVLARNFFPDVLEAPPVNLSEREALRLTIEDQRRKLLRQFKGRKFS
jgi:hypothetical protein